MDIYTVSRDFKLPVLHMQTVAGDTVSKLSGSVGTLVNTTKSTDAALWGWIGSTGSQGFLNYIGTLPDPPSGTIVVADDTLALTDGIDFYTLTGAALGFVPVAFVAIVVKPSASDDNVFATLRAGTLTVDGFTVDFSTTIPKVGYQLSYVIIG